MSKSAQVNTELAKDVSAFAKDRGISWDEALEALLTTGISRRRTLDKFSEGKAAAPAKKAKKSKTPKKSASAAKKEKSPKKEKPAKSKKSKSADAKAKKPKTKTKKSDAAPKAEPEEVLEI